MPEMRGRMSPNCLWTTAEQRVPADPMTSCHINGPYSFPTATSFAFKAEEGLSAFHLPQQEKVGKKKRKKEKGRMNHESIRH